MSGTDPAPAAVRDYRDAVFALDGDAARGVVAAELQRGTDPVAVLTAVITPAQHEAGRQWLAGRWTIAREHAATGIAVSAAELVAAAVAHTPDTRGHVVIACAEREWHALSATMLECALRADGWRVTQLGPAVSAAQLSRYLHALGPELTALSCSVAAGLPATRRMIEASTAAGIPVLVGGAAFGDDDRRAMALGATRWARDLVGAVRAAADVPLVVSAVPRLAEARWVEVAALAAELPALVSQVAAEAAPRSRVSTLPASVSRDASAGGPARDAVEQLVHAIAATVLTGDARIVTETVSWARELAGPEVVTTLVTKLADAVREFPLSSTALGEHLGAG